MLQKHWPGLTSNSNWKSILVQVLSQGEGTRISGIETRRDVGAGAWKAISWPLINCPTLCPNQRAYDKKIEGWFPPGVEARIHCLTIQNSEGVNWSVTSIV